MLAVINENKLDSWVDANAQEAQGVIVGLVWRLIAASCPNPLERRFPLGDSIGQQGPDGILNVNVGYTPFVPYGKSYWEIGTGRGAGAKATDDYTSLTSKLPEKTRKQSTFVFVTPRSGRRDWKVEAQASWLEERRNNKEWKDVQVIDGTILTDWIHQFPAIGIWLAGKIHGPQMDHIETPERRWEELRFFGAPQALTPKLFLSNRNNACEELQKLFDGRLEHLKLITRFPSQAVDFVCAYLASLDEERRLDVAGRCLIISEIKAWNTICNHYRHDKFVLVAAPSLNLCDETGSEAIQKAKSVGHAVVFDAPYGGPTDDKPSESSGNLLQAPRAHQIKEALVDAGHPEQQAHILSQRCGKNLSALLRLLQGLPLYPKWAEGPGSADLSFALLVGSWNHWSEADQAVIAKLTGNKYIEWIRTIREVSTFHNPPVIDQENSWKFISRYEGWYAPCQYARRRSFGQITRGRDMGTEMEWPSM